MLAVDREPADELSHLSPGPFLYLSTPPPRPSRSQPPPVSSPEPATPLRSVSRDSKERKCFGLVTDRWDPRSDFFKHSEPFSCLFSLFIFLLEIGRFCLNFGNQYLPQKCSEKCETNFAGFVLKFSFHWDQKTNFWNLFPLDFIQ